MKEPIRAVHEAEVPEFFRSIGMLEQFETGKVFCDVCREKVTAVSFMAAARVRGRLIFSCDRPACYLEFVLRTRIKG